MNILSILQDHRIPCKLEGQHEHARHGWVQIDCPFCSPHTSRFRLGISLLGGYANCWACGHKRLIDVLQEVLGKSYSECSRLLRDVGWERPQPAPVRAEKLVVPAGVGPLWAPHRAYLERRGYDPDVLEELWGIQGIGISGNLSWRIWIPIHLEGRVVSWTSRSIGDEDGAKYITASPTEESVSAKTLLYGEGYVRSTVIVHEGPADVWATGPGSVATLGLSYTQQQMLHISRYPTRVICFDNEPPAQRVARKLANELKLFPGDTYVVHLESGKDPPECDPKELQEFREKFLGTGENGIGEVGVTPV